jgi:hypothetical protein
VAQSIMYTDPNTLSLKEKKHVRLPWSTAIPYAEHGASRSQVQLTAIVLPKGFGVPPTFTCSVTTEHRAPIRQTSSGGSATCSGSLS